MTTDEFFQANGYAIHKGYKIGKTLIGEIFVEKDKALIGWAQTLAEAELIIDSLYGEGND